ncbi:MAG TPA: entericidin A/B family lipoprotein [Tepidisphaeraceae bacterium]|nr:entericidin A/B family lipoprotein [Tepidisphaeraceae bacterium]
MIKRFIGVVMVLSAMLVLPACNTVEGMGRDIERAGDRIEDAAD